MLQKIFCANFFVFSRFKKIYFSKVEEIYAPDVNEFVFITDDTYNRNQVLRMEHLMIKVIINYNFLIRKYIQVYYIQYIKYYTVYTKTTSLKC